MTSPSKNDITGDLLISKPTNDAYRENWDRIFGKREECKCDLRTKLVGDGCAVCNPPEKDHADSTD